MQLDILYIINIQGRINTVYMYCIPYVFYSAYYIYTHTIKYYIYIFNSIMTINTFDFTTLFLFNFTSGYFSQLYNIY